MVFFRRSDRLRRRAAVLLGVLCAAAIVAAPDLARAQGLFDFLFGGLQRQAEPPPVNSYAEPAAPPISAAPEHRGGGVVRGSGGGRFVAFCVRLCDGQHFPIDQLANHTANATPVETCRAMCPTARTKIFFGTEIDHAVARDGAHYADLDNAYVYRDHLVANCTCNGKNAFGLTAIDAKSDPTLRPGDIVSTANGPMAFSGKGGGYTATFTPVDPATLATANGARSPRLRLSQRGAESLADEEPGIIVPPPTESKGDLRGQVDR